SNGTVPVEVTVTDAGGGAAGFELSVDGTVEGTYAYGGSGTTTVTVDIAGDGQAHDITVTDIADPACTASTSVTTTDCSIPCSITNLAAGTGSSTVHTVFVEDFVFNPASITITAGDIVEWEWTGAVDHTTTSDATTGPDSWDSGLLGTGATYQSPQLSAGVHGYYCIPHGGPGGQGMAGTITVQADCTNGMVQATVTFNAQGGGPAGYEVLVDGTSQGTSPYAASGSNSATVPVPGDGQVHTITVQDAADPSCAAATTLTTPDCNAPSCSLGVSAQEAGGCSNGTVPVEVTVTDAGGGAAGFELSVDGTVEGTYAYGGSGTTTVTVDIAGDGQAHDITVTDIADPACTASTSVTTTDCSAPCQLSNLTVSTAGEPAVHVVEVRDFDFFPKDISVSPGDTVRFEWTGAVAHTTTSDATAGPSSWDSGLLDQGATYDVVLDEIGIHPYYCIPHGAPGGIGMAGSIEVVPDCDEEGHTTINLSFNAQGGGSAYHVFIDDSLHQDSPFDYAPDGQNELLLTVEGDGATHDLRVEDVAQSDCSTSTTFDAPFCKADESCGLMLSATEAGPCDSDNNVAVGLTIVRSGNTGGSFEVLVDGNAYPGSPFDYAENQDSTLLNIFIAGNGQDRMIVVADTDSTACSDTVMVNTPLCGAPCEVLGLEVSAGGNAKHVVEVADFEFIPAQLEVSVGDTVEFVWTGAILHTTTSDATTGPNSWNSGYLGQGATYQVVITEAGQHPYYCIPHGGPGGIGMAGTITAVEPCNEGEALATVSFTTTNGSSAGYQVFLDGVLIAGPIAYDDPEGFNSTSVPVPGDSMQHIITVQDLETSFCAASTTFTTPLCEQVCEIQELQVTTGPDLVHTVQVEDYNFAPQVLDVRTGETIRFLWTGSIPHTATSDATSGPDSWDSGLLGQGASYELTIQEEGAHPYYCIPHGGPGGIGMAGLINADPACVNDSVRVAVRFNLTNGSSNGYNLFVDGILMPGSPFPYDDPAGMNQHFLQLPGDGAQHFITVQDTEVGFCAATTSVTVPDCNASCAVEDLSASLPSPQRHEVAVEDFEFIPQQLDVLVGDTIAFVWNGIIPHTATSDATSGPDSWDSGLLGQGAVYEIVIQEAGEHPYYCIPHGGPGGVGMAGNITAADACEGEDVMVNFTFQAQGSSTALEWWLDGVFQDEVLAADGSFEALLPGDGASHEVILRDGVEASCADTVLVTTPDCEPAAEPCALNADIVLTEGCDEQGQVTYTLTVNATNGSADGFNLYIDGSLAADSPYPYNNAAGYPINLPGDGMNYHLEVVDTDSLDCVQELEVTTPDCSAACSMTLDTVLTDAHQVHIVQVRDFDFFPKDITVDVRDTVRFVWTGAVPHTATSDATQGPDSWNSGLLGQGAVYDVVLSTAGMHPYYCVPHGSPGGVGMAGTIEAVDPCADGTLLAAVQFSVTSPGINGYEVYVDGTLTPDSPYDYDTTATQTVFVELPADGMAHSLQVMDVEDADCQLQTNVVSPDCSDPCLGFTADFGFTVDPVNLSVQFEEAASEATDTWVWDFGDGSPLSDEPSLSHTYGEAGSYTVCLVATDLETACSDTLCQSVEVGGFVCEAGFTYEAEGLSVQFTSTAQSSSPVSNLRWTFGDGFSLEGEESPVYTYDTLGVYTICLTIEAEGCVDEYCMELDLSDPCLMFRPDFTFTVSEEDALRLQFVDLTTGAPNQWLWGFGDGITSNQQDPIHTYDNSGTYNVCLLVQDTLKGCNEALCMPLEVGVTGTAEARDANRSLTLYPNPAARHEAVWTVVGIEEQDYGQPLQLVVYDMHGKTVSKQQLQGQPQLQFEAPQSVAAGLYIVEIRSGEHLYQGRIMIQ
ncbi:MAG: PKD domain-containing protein, partial [Bacteroidetes bacterium]|nr:PKD domain-containing protein [Bacteroidota bacterium]